MNAQWKKRNDFVMILTFILNLVFNHFSANDYLGFAAAAAAEIKA